jgi:hypothetical protein
MEWQPLTESLATFKLRDALGHAVEPALPGHIGQASVTERLDPGKTVLLTCGNPASIGDIRLVATARGIRVETEDW